MSMSNKTRSALRATLKQEDAALSERLPVAVATPGAAAAEKVPEASVSVAQPTMANIDPAVVAPEKVVKAAVVKAKAAGSPTTRAKATAKPRPAKAVTKSLPVKAVAKPAPAKAESKPQPVKADTKPQPAMASPGAATATEPAKKKTAPKTPRVAAPVAESAPAARKGLAKTAVAGGDGGKKEKREKVVRDSFSIPASEHRRIKALREALGKAGRLASKSEVLRAGLSVLAERSTAELVAMLDALPVVAKGKRSKKH